MIADRHIFIIGQQRLVGAELASDVHRVVNPDVEIGVVADRAGQVHRRLDRGEQVRLDRGALRLGGQQVGQQAPQRARLIGPVREPVVEDRLAQRGQPAVIEQPRLGEPAHVEDHFADGDPDARLAAFAGKDAERQVLDRGERMAGRAGDPAGARGVVGFV